MDNKLYNSLNKFDGNIFKPLYHENMPANFEHLIPNVYIVKLGFRQGNTFFFSFSAQKYIVGVPTIYFEPKTFRKNTRLTACAC